MLPLFLHSSLMHRGLEVRLRGSGLMSKAEGEGSS